MIDLDQLAPAAIAAMASAGVVLRLEAGAMSFRAAGLSRAPEWREYLTERRCEVLWALLRADRGEWRAWVGGPAR